MTYLFRLLIGESLGEPAYHNNALYKLYAINLASLMKHDDIWIFAVKTNYIHTTLQNTSSSGGSFWKLVS